LAGVDQAPFEWDDALPPVIIIAPQSRDDFRSAMEASTLNNNAEMAPVLKEESVDAGIAASRRCAATLALALAADIDAGAAEASSSLQDLCEPVAYRGLRCRALVNAAGLRGNRSIVLFPSEATALDAAIGDRTILGRRRKPAVLAVFAVGPCKSSALLSVIASAVSGGGRVAGAALSLRQLHPTVLIDASAFEDECSRSGADIPAPENGIDYDAGCWPTDPSAVADARGASVEEQAEATRIFHKMAHDSSGASSRVKERITSACSALDRVTSGTASVDALRLACNVIEPALNSSAIGGRDSAAVAPLVPLRIYLDQRFALSVAPTDRSGRNEASVKWGDPQSSASSTGRAEYLQ